MAVVESKVYPHNIGTSSNDDIAVKVEHVSKKFSRDLKRAMVYGLTDLSRNIVGMKTNSNGLRKGEFWAVNDVSFNIRAGETLGIIGRNGSGKSTILKMLNGIYWPDKGKITIRGKVGALIEIGAGFHPMLTGRENIHLYSAILGMTKKEVDDKFDSVIEFADIGDFIDTPMKFYSSGMFVRLGFATAAHCEPDILLVDEVLSVGDMAFQAKSIKRMREFVDRGKTVVFVSHNLSAVQSFCERVIWLDSGRIMMDGSPADVIGGYGKEMDRRIAETSFAEMQKLGTGTGDIRVERVTLRNNRGEETYEFSPGESLTVEIHYHANKRIYKPNFWVGVYSQSSSLFAAIMMFDGFCPDYVEGKGVVSCTFRNLPLKPQNYEVRGGIRDQDGETLLIETRQFAIFRVVGNASDLGFNTPIAESLLRVSAPLLVSYEWRLPDGTRHAVNFDKNLKQKVENELGR